MKNLDHESEVMESVSNTRMTHFDSIMYCYTEKHKSQLPAYDI